jgi:hypothetical protein
MDGGAYNGVGNMPYAVRSYNSPPRYSFINQTLITPATLRHTALCSLCLCGKNIASFAPWRELTHPEHT